MTDALPATDAELQLIRRQLRGQARSDGVSEMDVDDVVDQAIAKAAGENLTRGAPTFKIRAHAALHDVSVAYFRRRAARPPVDHEAEVPERPAAGDGLDHLAFRELSRKLKMELGNDTLCYAILNVAGYSEKEIGKVLGWDVAHTARIRRRLGERAAKRFADLKNPNSQKEAS